MSPADSKFLTGGSKAREAPCSNILPIYHSPCVKIRIVSCDHEYTVSKDLLCRESKYFSAMFEGEYKEGQQQIAVLGDIEGVVSVQSFEAFLQWLYLRKIKFEITEPEQQISAMIELARFADMCIVTEMEARIARQLKKLLLANPNPQSTESGATFLPQWHAVRRILAAATVEGYLRCEHHRFVQEAREYLTYAVDLLEEVGLALKGLKLGESFGESYGTYQDPLDSKERTIYRFHR
ncbi:BTB/POZ domain-containing protein [Aspergillus lucknowensis]|uniref:BTB domain-containing protein n=1 Tax=Aspergillus lucknowensis TaxID=176173 RepID=A0ABR4L980_9EURO